MTDQELKDLVAGVAIAQDQTIKQIRDLRAFHLPFLLGARSNQTLALIFY